jgi:hypothetical protein
MNAQTHSHDETDTLLIDVAPQEVAAGAELTLRAAARCVPMRDLRGISVQIYDQDGASIGQIEFDELDGATNTTDALTLHAPIKVGSYTWRAEISAAAVGKPGGAPLTCFFNVTSVAHQAHLLAWGAPSAIAAGTEFKVTLGLKCSGGCSMAGRRIEIYDEAQNLITSVPMSEQVRAGSSGLHETEITLKAPSEICRQQWEARIAIDKTDPPHPATSAKFGLNIVAAPEHLVTLDVIDAETRSPIEGATVLMHPFRAMTDENGRAKVQVCKGDYTVWISAPKYEAVCKYVDVTQDFATKAELMQEPPEDPDAHYY